MIIDFNKLEKEEKNNFKNGDGVAIFYAYRDERNKIFKVVLNPQCSVGMHTHIIDQEIMYLLEGELEIIDDSNTCVLHQGEVNYCKQNHSHCIRNKSDKSATLICSVTKFDR